MAALTSGSSFQVPQYKWYFLQKTYKTNQNFQAYDRLPGGDYVLRFPEERTHF